VKLREMLIRTNMEDLRETTHYRHYELYRRCKLQEMGFQDNESMSMQETYESKRAEHLAELQKKEEEMRQMFVVRVKEKETELKETEKDLHNKFEGLKKQHTDELQKLDNERRRLEEEINLFNKRKVAEAAALQTSTMSKRKK